MKKELVKFLSLVGFFLSLVGFLVAMALLTSCSDSNETSMARLEVRLTDGPGDYEEVNIDIAGVEVHTEPGDSSKGWKEVEINKGVYDLLKLTNGLDTLLGSVELPPGHMEQVRLILGSNNSVKRDGQVLALTTPSAQQSGLKVLIGTNLQAGVTYTVLLDFDAARSITETGNGKLNLKPVIHASAQATSGAIKGIVAPLDAAPAIFAIMGSDTVASTFADIATGKFLVKGLDAGDYRVVIVPKAPYQTVEKTGVSVTVGTVTDLGTIQF